MNLLSCLIWIVSSTVVFVIGVSCVGVGLRGPEPVDWVLPAERVLHQVAWVEVKRASDPTEEVDPKSS